MEQAASYFFFAERFGWTPAEVDELPAYLASRMPGVAVVTDEIKAEREKAANSA